MNRKALVLFLLTTYYVSYGQSGGIENKQLQFVISSGFNVTNTSVLKTVHTNSDFGRSYRSRQGYSINFFAEYIIKENFYFTSGMSFNQLEYAYDEILSALDTLEFSENSYHLSVPILLGKGVSLAGMDLSIHTGLSINFILRSEGTLNYTFLGRSTQDLTFQRRRFTYGGLINIKVRKALYFFKIGLSGSYFYGFNNIVNEHERFTNQALVFDLAYVPDNLRLIRFHVDLELIFPITDMLRAFKS